jgi:ribosome-binding protein aMBF1 (putative translation factor)
MPRVYLCEICGEETTYQRGAGVVCEECATTPLSTDREPPERSRKEMGRKRKKRKQEHRAKLARKHAKSTIEKETS